MARRNRPVPVPLPLQGGVEPRKPILCLDFDGVLHSYTSGWQGAHVIADPPVPGFAEFLVEAEKVFAIAIVSSRNHGAGGIPAMRRWLAENLLAAGMATADAARLVHALRFPKHKPAGYVTLDDRAVTFRGVFPAVAELRNFRPWWQAALDDAAE